VKRTLPGLRAALALALSVPLAVAMTAAPAAATGTIPAAATWARGGFAPQVYAPYFETWTKGSLPAVARASGARDLVLAFLQTPKRGSCSVAWNGNPKQVVHAGGRYVSQVARLRALGGDAIPSFGGYSADQGGTEIADSCTSVKKIARAYETVVTTYDATWLDMDVEANSLGNKAGIARRSEALRLLQVWAARTHRRLRISFTIGVEPWGLPANCLAVLQSAVAHGVRFTVNIMAFDYYIKASLTGIDMGTAALSALNGTHRQLARLYPRLGQRQLWALEGITLLPGIDDYPKKTEVTYLSDARQVMRFALARGLPMLSIWAIQRDNGGCPGAIDSNSCSGIRQSRWAFSHLLERYAGR
jgi:Glycosyl hydrolases family 18